MSEIQTVLYGNKLYPEVLELRQWILRDPLGMTYSDEELEKDRDMVYFAYVQDNQVVGTVGWEKLSREKAQLRQMAVHPRVQGRGIGRKLVEYVEEHSRAAGFKEIHLDSRYTARGFYTALGFEEYGPIYQKIGLPHINMKKAL